MKTNSQAFQGVTSEAQLTILQSLESLYRIVEEFHLDTDCDLSLSLQNLRQRAASNVITLTVLGEFTSGKSTFINSLLRTDLLRTGILPINAVCTYISYGPNPLCEVTLKDGRSILVDPKMVSEYSSEGLCSADVAGIKLQLPSPLLDDGLVVVDTPGVNVILDSHESMTASTIEESNACVYIMDCRVPGSKTTIEFLKQIQGKIGKFFFVLNRADILNAEEQEEALQYVRKVLSEECGISDPRVLLLSATLARDIGSDCWNRCFDDFEKSLLAFMRSERDSVIYAEIARLLKDTIERSEDMLAAKFRLVENELSAHFDITFPDASEVLCALREQSTNAVVEDCDKIRAGFISFHERICRNLRQCIEVKVSTTRTTGGLVEVGTTIIDKMVKEHLNELDAFLKGSFKEVYARRQAQVRASISSLFAGVRWVDHKAVFSRPTPWICILIGSAAVLGIEILLRAPFADRMMSPWLGAAAAAVSYGTYHWIRNYRSFSPPAMPTAIDSESAVDAVSSGSMFQNAAANPIDTNMAPAHIGRGIGIVSGNTMFAVAGSAVTIGIYGVRLLMDKLSGRLDKMRNEMRSALIPVLYQFETKTKENGIAIIATGENAVLMSLSSVLDISMERYRIILDRIVRPNKKMQEKLERRRNEISKGTADLRLMREQVDIAGSRIADEMRWISSTYSGRSRNREEDKTNIQTVCRSSKSRNRVKLVEMSMVSRTFRGDRSLIVTWAGCLIITIVLSVASLGYSGAVHTSTSQSSLNSSVGIETVSRAAHGADIPSAGLVEANDFAGIRTALLANGYVAYGPITDVPGVVPDAPLHVQRVSCVRSEQQCEKLFVFIGSRAVWSEDVESQSVLSSVEVGGPGQFNVQVTHQLPDGNTSTNDVRYLWDGTNLTRSVQVESHEASSSEGSSVMVHPTSNTAPPNQRSDAQIEMDVVQAIDSSKALKSEQIIVVVAQRQVTLTGKVSNDASSELAEWTVSHVSGVTTVHNNLQLRRVDGKIRQAPAQVQQLTPEPAQARSGLLHYYGPPVAYGGQVVFDNLPKARLRFTYDRTGWQLTIKINPDGTKWVTLTSLKQGIQTSCDLGWEIVE